MANIPNSEPLTKCKECCGDGSSGPISEKAHAAAAYLCNTGRLAYLVTVQEVALIIDNGFFDSPTSKETHDD